MSSRLLTVVKERVPKLPKRKQPEENQVFTASDGRRFIISKTGTPTDLWLFSADIGKEISVSLLALNEIGEVSYAIVTPEGKHRTDEEAADFFGLWHVSLG